jgi:hypothetical protein
MTRASLASMWFAVAVATLVAAPARAGIQTSGPQQWPGPHEISLGLGGQIGISSYYVTAPTGDVLFVGNPPGGFRLQLGYDYRVSTPGVYSVWIDAGINFGIGGGCSFAYQPNPRLYAYQCGYGNNGDSIEPFVGVKLKFRVQPVPLVPYVRIDGSFVGIVNRFCGDNGFAIGPRVAGGIKYWLTKNVGLGLETGFLLGPAFYSGVNIIGCQNYGSHLAFYATWDMTFGADFAF